MPYIGTKVNVAISEEKEAVLRTRFGKAIELIPGKDESMLMLGFEDHCRLSYRGKSEPGIAYVEVKILGKSTKEAYNSITAEITKILSEELGTSPESTYVKFEETEHWGWNGHA